MLLLVVAAPFSGGFMLEAAKHLRLLKFGGSWINAAAWTAALLCWWLVLALFWFNRTRFEFGELLDGAPIRRPVASIPMLAFLIVAASGLGLFSAIKTVLG
ncbi:hypothetical protein [Brevundimonas sp. MEB006b]|uniref:hypothetical protein n=1 Tax=Brevundimonas sp. MEB006b TaxID=3040283 RepID=UPI00254ABB6A|nr:hypothetical protein [Brevundimonas sp. MEB006b]